MDELASAGAPLAALGVRALSDLIHPDIITAALNVGNMHLWKEYYLRLKEEVSPGSSVIDGEVVGDAEEAIVVH